MKTRKISEDMMTAFLEGKLNPLLEAVKSDDTLDLELRGDSVNIYYRGGSIFRVSENNGDYIIHFDTNYCTSRSAKLDADPCVDIAVKELPFYKQAMDWWFHENPKYEREFSK